MWTHWKGDVQKARIAGIVNHAETATDTNPEEGDVIASRIRFKVLIEFGVAPTGEGIECATAAHEDHLYATTAPERTLNPELRTQETMYFSTMCILS